MSAASNGGAKRQVPVTPKIPRYETTIVDEDTTCVRTRDRAAAKCLATKLIRDEKSFEAEHLYAGRWQFLVSEDNERKGWLPE